MTGQPGANAKDLVLVFVRALYISHLLYYDPHQRLPNPHTPYPPPLAYPHFHLHPTPHRDYSLCICIDHGDATKRATGCLDDSAAYNIRCKYWCYVQVRRRTAARDAHLSMESEFRVLGLLAQGSDWSDSARDPWVLDTRPGVNGVG